MNKKAVVLLSGGLDSALAVKIMLNMGIELSVLSCITVFCKCTSRGCCMEAKKIAQKYKLPFKVINPAEKFFKLIENPRFGYGKNINPCLDCRIMLFESAKEYMKETGASFIVTGEVLGERPMSQRMAAMQLIEKESRLEGLVLRPLSAKLLAETIPEKQGIVDREKLLSISGRSRKPQLKLAEELGIKDYPCPAGGCLLTDKSFANRMKDLINDGGLNTNDVHLLKIGRHFRINEKTKIIVGREESENKKIKTLAKETDTLMFFPEIPGPTTLIRGNVGQKSIDIALRITARYSDAKENSSVIVKYKTNKKVKEETVIVNSAKEEELKKWII